jgi:hypothetical protein
LEKLLPTVTTATEVTDITVNSATCGGEVTFDGNVSVTARGICWSTSQNPTIEDNKTTDAFVYTMRVLPLGSSIIGSGNW